MRGGLHQLYYSDNFLLKDDSDCLYAELLLQPSRDISEVHLRIPTQQCLGNSVEKT